MNDSSPDPRNFRVSDSEREHVVEILKEAIGRGMLDLDEFTERTDIALASRTRGELNTVLVDLPGLLHADQAPVSQGRAIVTPYQSSAETLELKAHGSDLVRKGRWLVPPKVVVRNKYGTTKLNFADAEFTSDVVNVELDTKWGSVEIIIPRRAAIDINAITEVKWGSLHEKTNSNGRTGEPIVVVTGKVHGGSLTIRYPRGR